VCQQIYKIAAKRILLEYTSENFWKFFVYLYCDFFNLENDFNL